MYLHPTQPRGYYHPIFAARLQKTLGAGQRFELMFVDTRALTWLTALVRGNFEHLAAVRLGGHALGPRRAANAEEVERWHRHVRAVCWTRGFDLLWKDVRFVQEITFDKLTPVRFGRMKHGPLA